MEVKIEKDIPIRGSFRTQNNKWREVLEEMDVGDSFLIDEGDDDNRASVSEHPQPGEDVGDENQGGQGR